MWADATSLQSHNLKPFINSFGRLTARATTLNKTTHYWLFEQQISLRVIPEQITLCLLGVCDKTGYENRNLLSDYMSNWASLSLALQSKMYFMYRTSYKCVRVCLIKKKIDELFQTANWHWLNLESVLKASSLRSNIQHLLQVEWSENITLTEMTSTVPAVKLALCAARWHLA